MPDDTEKLVVLLEARIRDFEKNMLKAEGTGTRSFQGLRKASASATKQMEADMIRSTSRINQALASTSTKIGAWGKGLGTSLAAGALAAGIAMLSLSAVINKTKEALDEFGDIADKSAQSGLDAEFFQGLTYQASLAGVSMEDLSGSLNSFSKNAGLAVVGKGKMIAALQQLNPALLENIRNAKSQEERVKLAADAINNASTASEKAALATTLFGNAGAKLIPVFDGGAAAIERTAMKARELGIIVDREVIARADKLGDEFDTAARIMDTQFKQAMVDLAPVLISTAQLAADVARAIASIVDSFRDLENQSTRTLTEKQATLMAQKADIGEQLRRLETEGMNEYGPEYVESASKELKAQLETLNKGEDEVIALLQARSEFNAENRKKATTAGAGDQSDTTLPPLPPPGSSSSSSSSSSRNTAAEDAVKQAEAVKGVIDNLMLERMQVGMTSIEIAKMNALRDAGAAATDEQKAKIVSLIETTAREKAAIEAVQTALGDMNTAARDATGTIIRGFRDGASAGEIMADVLTQLSDKLIDMSLNSLFNPAGSGAGGLLGMLFGGGSAFPSAPKAGLGSVIGFDEGGFTGYGSKYQPAGVVHKGEYVFDAASTRRIGVANLERLQGYADGGLVSGPSSMPGRSDGIGSRDRIDINLKDDSGRMADIAGKTFETKSGALVKISVQQSTKAVRGQVTGWVREDQLRYG